MPIADRRIVVVGALKLDREYAETAEERDQAEKEIEQLEKEIQKAVNESKRG